MKKLMKLILLTVGLSTATAALAEDRCEIKDTPDVRRQRTYDNPTDDAAWGDGGSIGHLLRTHGRYYRCTEVTENGYVRVEHGMGYIFTSYIPITNFRGNTIALTNGTRARVSEWTDHPNNDSPIPHPEEDSLPDPINPNEDFLDFFRGVADRTSGDRWELPMSGDGTEGPCGGKHIRSHRTRPHLQPIPACMFARVSQMWRERHCPDNAPHCRIMYGDAGFGHRMPGEWPHASHRRGQCIDIWPMRNPGAGLVETNINNRSTYNSDLTYQFTQLLIEEGGIETAHTRRSRPQAFFNDPRFSRLGFRSLVAHDDHLHVCFRNTSANQRRCNNFRRNPNICHFGQNPPQPNGNGTDGPRNGNSATDQLPFLSPIEM